MANVQIALAEGTLLQVRFDVDTAAYNERKGEIQRGIHYGQIGAKGGLQGLLQDQQKKGAEYLAWKARDMMSKWLQPGAEPYKIGWTGKAADNLYVVGPIGNNEYGVQEGSLTKANLQIRMGRRSQDPQFGMDDPKTLHDWAKVRGIKYTRRENEFTPKTKIRRKRKKKLHGNYASDYWTWRLAYRLKWSLWFMGASKGYEKRAGIGKRNFDYVKEYIQGGHARAHARNYFTVEKNVQIVELVGSAFFNYFATEMTKAHTPGEGFRVVQKPY